MPPFRLVFKGEMEKTGVKEHWVESNRQLILSDRSWHLYTSVSLTASDLIQA